MQHRPGGLTRADLQRPPQAHGQDAILRGGEEPADDEPDRQWVVRVRSKIVTAVPDVRLPAASAPEPATLGRRPLPLPQPGQTKPSGQCSHSNLALPLHEKGDLGAVWRRFGRPKTHQRRQQAMAPACGTELPITGRRQNEDSAGRESCCSPSYEPVISGRISLVACNAPLWLSATRRSAGGSRPGPSPPCTGMRTVKQDTAEPAGVQTQSEIRPAFSTYQRLLYQPSSLAKTSPLVMYWRTGDRWRILVARCARQALAHPRLWVKSPARGAEPSGGSSRT